MFPLVASFALLLASLYTDLLWRKIPNFITFPAFVLALFFHMKALGTFAGISYALKGAGVGMLFLFLPFVLGGSGGGDVKLFGALGSLLGVPAICSVFIYTAIAGGILSFFLLLKKKEFRLVKSVIHDAAFVVMSGGKRKGPSPSQRIPYSLPAVIGFCTFLGIGGIF